MPSVAPPKRVQDWGAYYLILCISILLKFFVLKKAASVA